MSEASSADPDDDRGDEPKGPITAAALLGSFFSLLRRMNNNLSTPLLRNKCFFGLSPIFCVAKHRGRWHVVTEGLKRQPVKIKKN